MGGVLLWIYLIIDDYFFNEMQFTHLQNTTLSFSKNVSFCIVAMNTYIYIAPVKQKSSEALAAE